MIHGTSIFSMSDLNDCSGYLYGKFKKGKSILDIELLQENIYEGTTDIIIKQTGEYDKIKTSKIFDLNHSNKKLW